MYILFIFCREMFTFFNLIIVIALSHFKVALHKFISPMMSQIFG